MIHVEEKELSYMKVLLIHPTQELYLYMFVVQFISHELK
jgi:hypothetical protein